MTLQQQADTAEDPNFQQRVRQSTYRAANAVVGEDPGATGFSESKTDKRHALGLKVLSGDRVILTAFYRAVGSDLGDVADPSTILDSAIDTSVDSMWDDLAGVKFGE